MSLGGVRRRRVRVRRHRATFFRRFGGDERGETRETPGEIRASRAEDARRKRSGDDGRGRERVSFDGGVRGDDGGERGDPSRRVERAETETRGEVGGAPGRHTRASPRAPRDGARRDAAATTKKGERFELGVRGGVRKLSDGTDERGDRREEHDAPRRAQFAERFRRAIFSGDFRRGDGARVTRGLSGKCRVAKRAGGVERRGDVPTDAIARVGGVLGRRDVRANDGDAETCLGRERGKRETGRFRHPTRSRRQRRRDGETRRMRIATRRMPIARRRRGSMPFRTRLRGRMPIGRLSVDAAEPSRGDERDAARAARDERGVAASKRRRIFVGRVPLDEPRRGDESRASRRAARTPERDFVLVVFVEIHRGDVRAGPRRARGRFRGGDGPRAPQRTAPRRVTA